MTYQADILALIHQFVELHIKSIKVTASCNDRRKATRNIIR